MTTTLGPLSGTAAARRRKAPSHEVSVTPLNRSAPGSEDARTSSAKRRSSSPVDRVEAVKYTCGTPARDRNSSTRRDLPTRRRPRINSALPGLPPPSVTRNSRPSSTFSCWSRPINADTLTPDLTHSCLVLPTLTVSPPIASSRAANVESGCVPPWKARRNLPDGVGCRDSYVALLTLRDDHRMGIPLLGRSSASGPTRRVACDTKRFSVIVPQRGLVT